MIAMFLVSQVLHTHFNITTCVARHNLCGRTCTFDFCNLAHCAGAATDRLKNQVYNRVQKLRRHTDIQTEMLEHFENLFCRFCGKNFSTGTVLASFLSSPPLSARMFKILSEWWQLSFRRILQQLQRLNHKFKWLWDEVAVAKQSNHCCLYTLRLESRVESLVRKMLTEGSWRVAFL